jgi:hypothetical protein
MLYNVTISPNMNLVVPDVGAEIGPLWAQDINASFAIIDQHTHASGSGLQINPAGLNINSDLPFGSNNATLLRSVRFSPQPSPLGLPADIGCLYETGGNLYFNDASGNQIQITKAGSVFASSSGISSGTATASFVSGTLVVNAASLTPANIQGASLLLGNNIASSNYLTLQPPSAMASSFTLTLPNIPSVLSSMTIDSSGNMGSITFDQVGVNMTSVGANAIANTRTRTVGTTAPLGGVAVSASSGFVNAPGTTLVTAATATLTTSGLRPVYIGLTSDGSGGQSFIGSSGGSFQTVVVIFRGATEIYRTLFATGANSFLPPSSVFSIDTGAGASSNTYTIQIAGGTSACTGLMNAAVLVAYEL